jgi:hypothetical protein
MDAKQNPFSLYDFLGYLFPGALVLYSALAAYGELWSGDGGLGAIRKYLSFKDPELYVPALLTSYVLGHCLSFLSSITIEKYAQWTLGGPPQNRLLYLEDPGYLGGKDTSGVIKVARIGTVILVLPLFLLESAFGAMGMRQVYARALDPLLREIVQRKLLGLIRTVGGVKNPTQFGTAVDHGYFEFAYHYAIEKADKHIQKIHNYVALYGFLRTMTLILTFGVWLALTSVALSTAPTVAEYLRVFVLIVASYVMYVAYLKFYYRYAQEVLMAFIVCFDLPSDAT